MSWHEAFAEDYERWTADVTDDVPFYAQLARESCRVAQRGRHFILGTAVRGAIGEVAVIVAQDVVYVGVVQAGKPVPQLRHEMCAVHVASPRILRTAPSKASHSPTCVLNARVPLLVIL